MAHNGTVLGQFLKLVSRHESSGRREGTTGDASCAR